MPYVEISLLCNSDTYVTVGKTCPCVGFTHLCYLFSLSPYLWWFFSKLSISVLSYRDNSESRWRFLNTLLQKNNSIQYYSNECNEIMRLIVVFSLIGCAWAQEAVVDPSVVITQGTVVGILNDGFYEFHGVPYADSTSGINRFKVRSSLIEIICIHINAGHQPSLITDLDHSTYVSLVWIGKFTQPLSYFLDFDSFEQNVFL